MREAAAAGWGGLRAERSGCLQPALQPCRQPGLQRRRRRPRRQPPNRSCAPETFRPVAPSTLPALPAPALPPPPAPHTAPHSWPVSPTGARPGRLGPRPPAAARSWPAQGGLADGTGGQGSAAHWQSCRRLLCTGDAAAAPAGPASSLTGWRCGCTRTWLTPEAPRHCAAMHCASLATTAGAAQAHPRRSPGARNLLNVSSLPGEMEVEAGERQAQHRCCPRARSLALAPRPPPLCCPLRAPDHAAVHIQGQVALTARQARQARRRPCSAPWELKVKVGIILHND